MPARPGRSAALTLPVLLLLGAAAGARADGAPGEAARAGETRAAGAGGQAGAGAAAGAGAPASSSGHSICDNTTAVTLIGMDTDSGRMLFAVPAASPGGRAYVVELDAAGREARAYADTEAGRFSGSVGPGPVIAAEPCGADCLQPVRWREGAWQPLGETLTVPTATTLSATYDTTGIPWFVAHSGAGKEGLVKAWAFRLEGREWKSHGGLDVTAVGQPQVLPAPQRNDGVVSGTGLFSASGPPTTWVQGLPELPANRRGQLVPMNGRAVAYVSSDGVAYLSGDMGKTWRRSTWTPWGTDTVGMWRQGTDYVVDLPFGDHRGSLQLSWFDRRNPSEERVLFTRLQPPADWGLLAESSAEVRSKNGDRMPVNQVLVPRRESWLLFYGCAATASGSGFVLRSFEGAGVSAPRFVPLTPRGPG